MRLVTAIALTTSAFALAACAGGGGGLNGSGTLSAAGMAARDLSLCAVQQNSDECIAKPAAGTVTPPINDKDGDGIPDGTTGTDGDGTTGSGAGGNATGLSSGNTTIALQGFIYDTPTAPAKALSVITSDKSTTLAAITAEILDPVNKPKSVKFQVDTKSPQNSQFAVPLQMDEYRSGTRDLTWIKFGHTVGGFTTPPVLQDASGGFTVKYNAVKNTYFQDVNGDGLYKTADGDLAVNYREDFYWNQLTPLMDARANGGTKDNYREYRVKDDSINRDELLQVWAWDNSYATQYQNVIGGGTPKQQAWSFGGNATSVMPTGGSATYKGRFVAAAKTSGWVKPEGADIDPNALWRVEGQSSMDANFASGAVDGTLTPETWTSKQTLNGQKIDYTWNTTASSNPSTGTIKAPDYYYIYDTKVAINAKLDPSATAGTVANTFSGRATLDEPYITYTNPAHGGFFDPDAGEITGIFNAAGARPDPIGGTAGINDSTNGYLTINGAFNGKCTNAGGVCPP
jgi:hypothetical protein